MKEYTYVTLRQKPELKEAAVAWFHDKWEVPQEAYLECMEAYLNHETEYGWYLCLDNERIVGGLGVIENDFHDRKDLAPNVCAVYTEQEYRCQGIAGQLLDIVVRARPCLTLWNFSLIRKMELCQTNKPPAMQVSQHCFSLQ